MIYFICHTLLPALLLYFSPSNSLANTTTYLLLAVLGTLFATRLVALAFYHLPWWYNLKSHPGLILLVITIIGTPIYIGLLGRNRLHVNEVLYSSWALSIVSGKDIFLRFVLFDKPPVPIFILALSPYDIQFSSTVFSDPLMVMLVFNAVLLALNQRSLALALIPILLVALYTLLEYANPRRLQWRMWLVTPAGIAAIRAGVGVWDVVIRADIPRFLTVQTVNYNGLYIVSNGEI